MAFLLLLVFLVFGASADQYIIGKQGQSCYEVCLLYEMNCAGQIQTNDTTALFTQLGVNCLTGFDDAWTDQGSPALISDSSDSHFGYCVGYQGVPTDVMCGGSNPQWSRLCNCVSLRAPTDVRTFGTGLSAGVIPTEEFEVFQWVMPDGAFGVLTHFWITSGDQLTGTIIRYYVDGETSASVAFNPGLASGTGFGEAYAPWGTSLIGKGAATGSWWNNIRVPFGKSIRVTWQSNAAAAGYIIIRGAPNLPIHIGDFQIPTTARLKLYAQEISVQPLDYVDVVNIPAGTSGAFLFHTLAVSSGNQNFMEGCYRYYSPPDQAYPGTLLSTGTEDYYDSGWYFSAGEFRLPVSGYTHYDTDGAVHLSAYRFHEMDPIIFSNGLRFVWRNGDAIDPKTGLKCFIELGGNVVGTPTNSDVLTYGWVYVW